MTLFQENLLKVRPRYKKLVTVSEINTSLINSYTNALVLELHNSAIESTMMDISQNKDLMRVLVLARQLQSESENYRGLMRDFERTKHVTDAVRRRFGLI